MPMPREHRPAVLVAQRRKIVDAYRVAGHRGDKQQAVRIERGAQHAVALHEGIPGGFQPDRVQSAQLPLLVEVAAALGTATGGLAVDPVRLL